MGKKYVWTVFALFACFGINSIAMRQDKELLRIAEKIREIDDKTRKKSTLQEKQDMFFNWVHGPQNQTLVQELSIILGVRLQKLERTRETITTMLNKRAQERFKNWELRAMETFFPEDMRDIFWHLWLASKDDAFARLGIKSSDLELEAPDLSSMVDFVYYCDGILAKQDTFQMQEHELIKISDGIKMRIFDMLTESKLNSDDEQEESKFSFLNKLFKKTKIAQCLALGCFSRQKSEKDALIKEKSEKKTPKKIKIKKNKSKKNTHKKK